MNGSGECLSATVPNSSTRINNSENIRNLESSRREIQLRNSHDEPLILNALKSCTTKIEEMVKVHTSAISTDVKRNSENLKLLKDNISELNNTVVVLARMMFNKQGTITSRQSQEVERTLVILPEIFNEKLICTVLTKCFICHCLKTVKECGMINAEDTGSIFLKMMNFSILPTDKKREKYMSRIGKEFSAFRHGVLMSAILALQVNAFETFITEREAEAAARIGFSGGGRSTAQKLFQSKLPQPRWLKRGYITIAHCEEAAIKQENRKVEEQLPSCLEGEHSQVSGRSSPDDDQGTRRTSTQTQRTRQRRVPSDIRNVIGIEATSQMYRLITLHLHKARDAFKMQVFHDGLYIFTSWCQHKSRVDQGSLRVKWMDNNVTFAEQFTDIPIMNEVPIKQRYESDNVEVDDTNALNVKLVSEFIQKHPEMTLVVSLDV